MKSNLRFVQEVSMPANVPMKAITCLAFDYKRRPPVVSSTCLMEGVMVAVGGRLSYSIWGYGVLREGMNGGGVTSSMLSSSSSSSTSSTAATTTTLPTESTEILSSTTNEEGMNQPLLSFLCSGTIDASAGQDHRLLCVKAVPSPFRQSPSSLSPLIRCDYYGE